MKTKPVTSSRALGWALLLPLLTLAGSGCIVVEDNCLEGEIACHDDYYVEQCVDDTWVIVDDCDVGCGGVCGYLDSGETVCVCPL